MNRWYNKPCERVMEELEVDFSGLTEKEVTTRRDKYGFNELIEGEKASAFLIFLEQFKDLLVIILLGAATISIILGDIESSVVIFLVVILNAILGTVQHIKAAESLNSLKKLSSPTAKVLRGGVKIEIPSREVIVGDIVYLDAGDYICADGRVIENYSLQVNESSLTGESESVNKQVDVIDEEDIPLGDRKNMVYSGSLVTYGRAKILVTEIGMKTEIGKVAMLLDDTSKKKTPLQVSLDDFGKKLAIGILIICALVFALNIYRGYTLISAFMFAVALAVAAIPEALSSIVTIVLAIGTQKMAKEHSIIKQLQAVEGLGSVSVICSDKTGTLTQNKMTVKRLFVDDKVVLTNDIALDNNLQKNIIMQSILCNDSIISDDKEIGDPTEVALVNLGRVFSINELELRKMYPRLGEIPFDSDRKLMSTVHNIDDKNTMITKGAVDVIIRRVTHIQTNNGIRKVTKEDIKSIENKNEEFSKLGLRVLGFAYKEIEEKEEYNLEDEKEYTFVGLISMMDPPREESKKAVEECIKAGIRPIMITGDHKITAMAIAKEIGILHEGEESVEGREIENLTDEQLIKKVQDISVYSRVSPEHKIRIVKAWQSRGNIVAMTGDGVNDAPALKASNIGVAMGITGTEVAKDAAAMVLTDDNFATIVKAVENGRNIYNNIRSAIKFLLSGNTAGILSVLWASILALPMPFTAVHLLFINLVTDSLPAIALGVEPYKENVMKEKPRGINTPILTKDFTIELIFEGIIIAIVTMLAFKIGNDNYGEGMGRTMAFATLCLSRLLHGFSSRGNENVFRVGMFKNKYSWLAFGVGSLLLFSILLVPALNGVFEVTYLGFNNIINIILLSLCSFIVIQIGKTLKSIIISTKR
ncbi:Ca2+-transporting ATPase [Clostridium cavendishii DSM 21758]|uniref:P-type Ca(2+) transporter n=1 Tax=Clostridium cavendishii DSM 21758 TaxID=1121302 RepID=A0A1M6DA50_9CLOT|nr:cation-translocating P-type ATPase [Clostridium cavendishii]SHI70116.1 Ca2+-transporting ATPase [Clostridium cavendishii DSM 21758]